MRTTGQPSNGLDWTGVLVGEPGTLSYGLGALVVGRVCEVAYERMSGTRKRFSHIMKVAFLALCHALCLRGTKQAGPKCLHT